MRKFQVLDKSGSKRLSRVNFKRALTEGGVAVTDKDQDALFSYFDINADGMVSFEEFAQAFRGPLNERRRRVVETAFASLSKQGNNVVNVEAIKDTYDAFKNPEVVAGKKTADQAYREFLEHFEVGGEVENRVTLQEFISYYEDLGVSVDNDDYFELVSSLGLEIW